MSVVLDIEYLNLLSKNVAFQLKANLLAPLF